MHITLVTVFMVGCSALSSIWQRIFFKSTADVWHSLAQREGVIISVVTVIGIFQKLRRWTLTAGVYDYNGPKEK
jgi:hypothetical protein